MASDYDAKNHRKQLDGDEAVKEVRSLLAKFRCAMLTTIGGDGCVTRPMGVQGDPDAFHGTLWFFTDRRSRKAQQIARGDRTTLLFQNDGEDTYLQLNGSASLVRDTDRMKELFNPLMKTWFPDGVDDPDLTLIRFEATDGQYWTSTAGMLQVLAAFTKAVVTGRPGQGGEMGDVTLR